MVCNEPRESLPQDDLPSREPTVGFDLLQGVRILDLTTSIAGPYGTMLLADLGADVVKVEKPGAGDDSRSWGPPFLDGAALWFLAVNRNKRSVAIDMSTSSGSETLRRLVSAADVLVSTFRQNTLKRLGIDYDTLRELNPGLIHCTITGYGLTGTDRDLAGYDLIAEGVSGIMDLTGEPDSPPQKVGTPAADLLAGMDAAYAIVAALYDRQRSGRGHQLDISLVESMTRFLTPKLISYLGSGERQRRAGGRDSVVAVYQVFDTADEPITLALGNNAHFQRFCALVGREDLAADPQHRDNAGRRANRPALVAAIQEIVRQRTKAEWLRILREADVPAGPVNHLEDVLADPHLAARQLFYRIPGAGVDVPQVNTGWQLDGEANGYRTAPPELGADTDAVLSEWLAETPNHIGPDPIRRKK